MNYYDEIKEALLNNEITKRVKDYSKNKSDLSTYYNVGKMLYEAGKHYGEGIIKEYSSRLTEELGKIYNQKTLRSMRQFYRMIMRLKWPTLSAKLSYSHYLELAKFNDESKILYYVRMAEVNNLSIRQLRNRIKSNEYERLPLETRDKLIMNKDTEITDFVKNPIIIRNINNQEINSEKILHKLILENILSFMKELGEGYHLVDSEYKIKLGDTYNYLDLLLYNKKYRCYVVVELKVTELKKEYIGQVRLYMNYIDKEIKDIDDNKTIGIIICKRNNKYVIEYSSDSRIIAREYEVV